MYFTSRFLSYDNTALCTTAGCSRLMQKRSEEDFFFFWEGGQNWKKTRFIFLCLLFILLPINIFSRFTRDGCFLQLVSVWLGRVLSPQAISYTTHLTPSRLASRPLTPYFGIQHPRMIPTQHPLPPRMIFLFSSRSLCTTSVVFRPSVLWLAL